MKQEKENDKHLNLFIFYICQVESSVWKLDRHTRKEKRK